MINHHYNLKNSILKPKITLMDFSVSDWAISLVKKRDSIHYLVAAPSNNRFILKNSILNGFQDVDKYREPILYGSMFNVSC